MLCLHRSVWCLCDGGWAFAAPVLIRTMMDLLISALAVAYRKNDREFMGFKYMYGFQKAGLADPRAPASARGDAQLDIANAMEQMSSDDQARAREFLRTRLGKYWYNPEYKNPSDVLDKTRQTKQLKQLYVGLSSAAHAGFGGLREFRDNPRIIDSAPRNDRAAQNRALGLSTRLLLEFALLRAAVEFPSGHQNCRRLMSKLADACSECQLLPEP